MLMANELLPTFRIMPTQRLVLQSTIQPATKVNRDGSRSAARALALHSGRQSQHLVIQHQMSNSTRMLQTATDHISAISFLAQTAAAPCTARLTPPMTISLASALH